MVTVTRKACSPSNNWAASDDSHNFRACTLCKCLPLAADLAARFPAQCARDPVAEWLEPGNYRRRRKHFTLAAVFSVGFHRESLWIG
jgi:hypothetical protein